MFNSGEEVSKKLLSDPVDITVKALPSPKPQEFADMVGAFTLTGKVSKSAVSPGETATVTIEVKGQGALDRMRDVKLSVAGARIYADKPTLTEKIEAGAGLVSTRVFKFAVVPDRAGSLELGAIKLGSFNPFTEKYDILTASLGTISVTGGSATNPDANHNQATFPSAAGGTQDQAADQKNAINSTEAPAQSEAPSQAPLTPKTVSDEPASPKPWYLGPVALAVEILILSALAAWIVVSRGWRRLKSVSVTSGNNVGDNISSLLSSLEQGDAQAIDDAVLTLKKFFAAEGQDAHAMTSQDLLRAASLKGLDQSGVEAMRRLVSELDRRQYSESGGDAAAVVPDIKILLQYIQSRGV